jgi:hypothetical protein
MSRRAIPPATVQRIRAAAHERCGYCLSPQHLVMAPLEIEHLRPVAQGGSDDEANLWLACPICNSLKSDKTIAADPFSGALCRLFNPRIDIWKEHFDWADDGRSINGLTAIGRATVALLRLDGHPIRIAVWSYWIRAGWHPPRD